MKSSWFLCWLLCIPVPALAIGEFPPDTPYKESEFSISHLPPTGCVPYEELYVVARTVWESPQLFEVELRFRSLNSNAGFYLRSMEQIETDVYASEIPARTVGQFGAEYYIVMRHGNSLVKAGSAEEPYMVPTEYSFSGEPPEELPGDDFLREFEPPPNPVDSFRQAETARKEEEGTSTFMIQIALLLILGVLGLLTYQRLGRK